MEKIETSYPKGVNLLLMLMISADCLLILLHTLHRLFFRFNIHFPSLENRSFSLETDLGIAESFQYIKEFWMIILVLIFIWKYKESIILYVSWSFLFAYLLLDDMLSIHDQLAPLWVEEYQLGTIASVNVGELTITAVVGMFFCVVLSLNYIRAGRLARVHSRYFMLFVVVLAGFGVGFDIIHSFFSHSSIPVIEILAIIEESGELFVMSFSVWATFILYYGETVSEFRFIPLLNLNPGISEIPQ